MTRVDRCLLAAMLGVTVITFGCSTTVQPVFVPGTAPQISAIQGPAGAPLALYEGVPISLQVDDPGDPPAMQFNWDFGGGVTPDTSVDARPRATPGTPGVYHGTVTATNDIGSSTYNFSYTVLPLEAPTVPNVQWRQVDGRTPLHVNDSVNFWLEYPPGSSPATTWTWEFDGTCPNSSESSPTRKMLSTGTFHCYVTVTNPKGSVGENFTLVVLP
jgi:PKD repeat protein